MKKFKTFFSVIFILTLILTGCSSKNNAKNDNENSIKVLKNLNDYEKNKKENTNNYDARIISIDANTNKKKVIANIKINDNLSIKDKLNIVIKELSKLQFQNAPIELTKIDNNIAYINIKEDKENKLWSNRFFQGSTGANITSYTLVESLLQRDYEGRWIDGIYITYEGRTDVEFDHLDIDFFGNTIKR
ncbi:hypothetical protein GCM10008904_20310 [Paraclostridium ghonii]|uniref:Lipoprotein n=1 Tax=Paraclostridium ghonii TaxID=29358 RepID=A0ABU0MWL0_9FIRM|nr:hypothetical protein [Paeniclostridium ghonii]MDQ0555285.1 hypothetical protein [Paeniclostridium ghonii]